MSKPQLVSSPVGPRAPGRRVPLRSSAASFQGAWRDPLRRRLLALADLSALLVGALSLGLVFHSDLKGTLRAAAVLPVWLVFAKLYGLYDGDHTALRHLTVDELPSIFFWTLTATAGTALVLHVTHGGGVTFGQGLRLWITTSVAAFTFRSLVRFGWRHATRPERVLILGEGPLAEATQRKLELFSDMHAEPIDAPGVSLSTLVEEPELLQDLEVDRIVLATRSIDEQLIARLVSACRTDRIKLSVVPPMRGMFGTAVRFTHVADLPVLEYNTWDVSRSTLFLKDTLDVTLSLAALAILSPIFLLTALLVTLDSRGPIIFSQVRVGMDGRRFRMHKFRTMVPDAEARLDQLVSLDALSEPMFKFRHDPRVTWIGRFLRRTSLDELPQLVNVLRGEMSLVGPRPEQVELVERYNPDQVFRLAVRPGITGPMQVYGRGELSFEERLAVERDYIENLSLGRDLRIMALTIGPVLSGKGAF